VKAIAASEAAAAPSLTTTAVAPVEAIAASAEPMSASNEAIRRAPTSVREAVPASRAAVSNPEPPRAAFPSAPEDAPASAGASPSAPPDAAVPHPDPAASLFADANRARRDGNIDRAVALYQSLQTRFPGSSESELSRALLAQMLLERGSPEAALAGFDRYLAEDAPVLGAEALVGRARALEQLGKSESAILAWKQVQSRFPGSVHARLAAARLAALGR
jgi:TolA-binding protein